MTFVIPIAAAAATGGAVAWTPASLSPEGWWRADLGHSASDAGTVNPWTNQGSDSSFDLSQATAGLRPTFDEVNANFNGQASLHYNAATDLHSSVNTAGWEIADGANDFTYIAVARVDSTSRHELMSTAAGNGDLLFRITTNAASVDAFEDTTGTKITSSSTSRANNTTYVKATVFKGATSPSNDNVESFFDGVSTSSDNGDLGNIRPNAGSGAKPIVFGGTSTTVATLDGDIAEKIILKRQLTSGEHTFLVSYLNTRYDLSLTAVV